MKGYYKRKSTERRLLHATVFKCDHPLYSACTLFKIGDFGLGVVQKRFNDTYKCCWFDTIDPWLANDIYDEPSFMEVFGKLSGPKENGFYPVIEVRKLMYKLGMKPMKIQYWESI